MRVDDLAGDDEDERGVPGSRLRQVAEVRGDVAQRGESVGEDVLGLPGERGVPEAEQRLDLGVEEVEGGRRGGGSGDGGTSGFGRGGPQSTAHDARRFRAVAERPWTIRL